MTLLDKRNSARLTKLLRYAGQSRGFHYDFKAHQGLHHWYVVGSMPRTTSRFNVRNNFTRSEALTLVKHFIISAWSRLKRRFGELAAHRLVPQFADIPELTKMIAGAQKDERLAEGLKKLGRSSCFRCDGTGQLCDTCGESPNACSCERDGLGVPSFSSCADCGGNGR